MATDVEIDRALNALSATLNDQRPDRLDPARIQAIVDGATGQERRLHAAAAADDVVILHDGAGRPVARVEAGVGDWTVVREAPSG